jgi:hypothetical protein
MDARPQLEVADVVREHGDDYRLAHHPSAAQEKVLSNIAVCRTALLGGNVDECLDGCGHIRVSYNSCRDRHCPKCQGPQRAEWLAGRLIRVLPTEHFHVVFTIPDELNPLVLRNKKTLYKILFDSASQTLLDLARDGKRLGAFIGITAVLHTWGQNLLFHPHLHCIVTGGGLSPYGAKWIPGRERYLLPVAVIGKLFRGKFLDALHRAYKSGKLDLAGSTAGLADPMIWSTLKDQLYRKNWVVYAKPPFGGVEHVFKYLGRYTHRVAISNHRLIEMNNGHVTFSLRDYKNSGQKTTMTLSAVEFLRRFLLHVLPGGFTRIRHYGLYAGRNVKDKLATARRLLDPDSETAPPKQKDSRPWWERFLENTGVDVMRCPRCGGRLVRTRRFNPSSLDFPSTGTDAGDTS